MAWNDDSWKDGYDAWKLRSPDDDYPEECIHEEHEADINGRATCHHCGETWYLSSQEIEANCQLHADYDKMMRQEERRERLERLIHLLAFWRRWRKPSPIDDEIPF